MGCNHVMLRVGLRACGAPCRGRYGRCGVGRCGCELSLPQRLRKWALLTFGCVGGVSGMWGVTILMEHGEGMS